MVIFLYGLYIFFMTYAFFLSIYKQCVQNHIILNTIIKGFRYICCMFFFVFIPGLDESAKIEKIKELLGTLPRPIIIVMRYLFAFLNQ